jgi:hypothetical protein
MVTPSRPHRGHRLGLPWAARKWLLGARVYYDDNDELRNSGIVRLQHLIVRARSDEDWQKYLDDLQAEWGPVVAAKRAIWKARIKRPASAPSRLVARLRKLLGASRREQRGGPARLLPEDFDPEAID